MPFLKVHGAAPDDSRDDSRGVFLGCGKVDLQ